MLALFFLLSTLISAPADTFADVLEAPDESLELTFEWEPSEKASSPENEPPTKQKQSPEWETGGESGTQTESFEAPGAAIASNSISGFLWIDANEDGICNHEEWPIANYPVYLYSGNDINNAMKTIKTDAFGKYEFTDIQPGWYAAAIKAEENGTEYLLPMIGVKNDNMFLAAEGGDHPYYEAITYSDWIWITADTEVSDINAGMRIPKEAVEMPEAPNTSESNGGLMTVDNGANGETGINDQNESSDTSTEPGTEELETWDDLETSNALDAWDNLEENDEMETENESEALDHLEETREPETDEQDSASLTSTISGFLWVDGNGSLPTDWDGLYNGDEMPLAGFMVSLYAADGLTAPVTQTQTGANGEYCFKNLTPGDYVAGLTSAEIGGIEFLLPMAETNETKFFVDWNTDPLMAFTKPMTLQEDSAIVNINAGMRLPMGINYGNTNETGYRYLVYRDSDNFFAGSYHWLAEAVDACGLYAAEGSFTIIATENDTDVTDSTAAAVTVPSTKTITLTSDENGTYTITQPNMARHLAVNGHLTITNITLSGRGDVTGGIEDNGGILVNGALTMNGGVIQNCYSREGGGIAVSFGGAFTMNGGKITGNTAYRGGGVFLIGAFTMNGGEITGNDSNNGGGVFNNGSMIFTGGAISGNINDGNGGGIFINNGGATTMTGGEINGNKAWSYGGGIHMDGGVLNVEGGTISDNAITGGSPYKNGAGVSVANKAIFTLSGGLISGNMNARNGGGVCAWSGTFIMEGGEIRNNSATNGGGVYGNRDSMAEIAITTGVISGNTATANGGGVYVASPCKFAMVFDAIDENHAGNGGGLYLDGGISFTMQSGKIERNTATYDGGGVHVNGGSVFTLESGAIVGNTAGSGGGVCVRGGGSFTLNDGTIRDNSAEQGGGVGMYIETETASAQFTMTGGEIRTNTAKLGGGGVYLNNNQPSVSATFSMSGGRINRNTSGLGGGGVNVGNNSTFSMAGGEISDNKTPTGLGGGAALSPSGTFSMTGGDFFENEAELGGGVFMQGGLFTMTDGRIHSNVASDRGGGVFVGAPGSFTMNGGEIEGNSSEGGSGGGVYATGGALAVNGGKISGNYAGGNGGGVYMQAYPYDDVPVIGSFTMTAGQIADNVAKISGGGVFVNDGVFTMSGSQITDNAASEGSGGGVYVNAGGAFTMISGAISGNTTYLGHGGGVYAGGAFKMDGGTNNANDAPNGNGGGIFATAYANLDIASAVLFKENSAIKAIDLQRTAAELLTLFPMIKTVSHTIHPTLNLVHPLNNYDINVEEYTVLVYYVDESDNAIGSPNAKQYTVPMLGALTLTGPEIPDITGYIFSDWKIGLGGIPEGNTTVALQNIAADMELYLIYRKTSVATLTVTKTVTGDYGNKTRAFLFTVYFEDSNGVALPSGTMFNYTGGILSGSGATAPPNGTLTLDSEGKAAFTLQHGQTVTMDHIAADGKIRVAESADPLYIAYFTDSEDLAGSPTDGGDTGVLDMTEDARTLDFVNARIAVPETGVDAGNVGTMLFLPLLALLAGLTGLTTKVAYRHRRKEDDYDGRE